MKTYDVTFREWVYQEKEITVKASSREEALILADEQLGCPDDENRDAEWYGSKFKPLKPKIRIGK